MIRAFFILSKTIYVLFRLHLSLQYRTLSQSFRHFFLQVKGLPQVLQIFSGFIVIFNLELWRDLIFF